MKVVSVDPILEIKSDHLEYFLIHFKNNKNNPLHININNIFYEK